MNKLSDKHFRTALIEFFGAVQAARSTDETDLSKLHNSNVGFTMNEQGFFKMTPDFLTARAETVAAIAKRLGGDIVHEKDVQDRIWNAAMRALEAEPSEWSELAKGCLKELEEELGNPRFMVCSNEVLYFDGIDRLTLGSVEALTGVMASEEINSKPFNERFNLFVGEPSMTVTDEGKISLGISNNCWLVETRTSKSNQRATAEWLIGVALTLLRLTCLSELGSLAPDRGDVEPNPISNAPRDSVMVFDEKQFTLPGSQFSARYVANASVQLKVASPQFQRSMASVFDATPGSLGERFQRCLGWQAKARQARDRSERFLFFFTALEALLAHSDVTSPVIDTVARHAASLLSDDHEHRVRNSSLVKALYQTRSKLVHSGSRAVTEREQKAIQEVVENVSWCILNWVDLESTYTTFQDRLREASFGTPFKKSQEHWLS